MKGVFVIGAGPAGLFAARKIALAGYEVFVFNRDIKPGGLAEYGIYPAKYKMRAGLRKQFAQVLEMPNVHYFGNVQIGLPYDITIDELEAMQPAAILFACGAQETNKLALPGEELGGVYAAEDFVYHYNQLPSHAGMDFSTGKRIAIVGMGNVAIDIARWLLEDCPEKQTENVLVIARRGPSEIKFDEKEIEHVEAHISRADLENELERVRGRCARCYQDVSPEKVFEHHFHRLKASGFESIAPRLSFRFLSSPTAFLPNTNGRVAEIRIADNNLVLKDDGSTTARPNGETTTIEVDTVIFAIGNKHDAKIGLPMGSEGYATRPDCLRPNEPSFEVWDPVAGCVLPGRFVAGWARKASTGLVGIARHDGESCADKVLEHLRNLPDCTAPDEAQIRKKLKTKGLRIITKADLDLLAHAEARETQARHVDSFKFSDNDAMFEAIYRERERAHFEDHALTPSA
ncbi:MAG: FAD-dependent oxidoreductase [Terracidiphilus sp.]